MIAAEHAYSFSEYLWSGGTALGWWNEQRIWAYKRSSSYLFAVIDSLLKLVGHSDSGFIISAKVSDEDVMTRYEQEKMEFGGSTPMFGILSSVAMVNLFCLIGMGVRVIWGGGGRGGGGVGSFRESLMLQMVLCGVLVLMNLPLYDAAFIRTDKGRLPASVTLASALLAASLCSFYSLVL